jgi:hypothetical protein
LSSQLIAHEVSKLTKPTIPSTFAEFSSKDDATREAAHGGWSKERANAFFPVVKQGELLTSFNRGMQPQPFITSQSTYTPGRQQQPDLPWPEFAPRDDFKPSKPRPY